VLNLETNQIVETCEVTFDETQPCSQLAFECAGDDELATRSLRRRSMNLEMMKMAVWCPRLNMYLLL
jgi:prophage DNA circulation protein